MRAIFMIEYWHEVHTKYVQEYYLKLPSATARYEYLREHYTDSNPRIEQLSVDPD